MAWRYFCPQTFRGSLPLFLMFSHPQLTIALVQKIRPAGKLATHRMTSVPLGLYHGVSVMDVLMGKGTAVGTLKASGWFASGLYQITPWKVFCERSCLIPRFSHRGVATCCVVLGCVNESTVYRGGPSLAAFRPHAMLNRSTTIERVNAKRGALTPQCL